MCILAFHAFGLLFVVASGDAGAQLCFTWAEIAFASNCLFAIHLVAFEINPAFARAFGKDTAIATGQAAALVLVSLVALAWVMGGQLTAEVAAASMTSLLAVWVNFLPARRGRNGSQRMDLLRHEIPKTVVLVGIFGLAGLGAVQLPVAAQAGLVIGVALTTQIGYVMALFGKR
jgi:hypothetical protein